MSEPNAFESTVGPNANTAASGLAETFAEVHPPSTPEADTSSADAPVAWDRYELQGEIGAGGMGRVYRAKDRQFGRTIALKQLLHPDRSDARDRFELESFVTGNLEHPGIPAVYERGVDSGRRPFYAMRHVQGKTLGKAIDECADLSARLQLVPVLIRVAQTLAYAHSQGVVHRDIKPDNVVIGEHGEAFVLDWGIAKIRGMAKSSAAQGSMSGGRSGSSTATIDGQVIGTPAYMAPEQAAGNLDRIDERTDVFAIGAILYHLLSGHPPYQERSLGQMLDAAKNGSIADIESEARDAPRALRIICKRALEKNPQDRFSSAEAMATALEVFAADAIRHEDTGPVGRLAAVASVLSVVLALAATVITLGTIASVRAQGLPAYLNFGLAAFGAAFIVIEYRSQGRYRLAPLIVGMAMATLLNGVAATFTGISKMLEYAGQEAIFQSHGDYRAVLTVGTREAVSNMASSAALAMVLFLGWSIVRRHTLLSQKRT